MRTKIGAVVALVGAALLAWGIARSVSDGAHTRVSATLPASEAGYVATEPGVLDLVNTKVHVEAKGNDGETAVTVALGSSEDVSAWTEGLSVVRVTGLETWDALAGKPNEATVEETPPVAGSDMWTRVESGKGKVSFDYEVADPGAVSLVARTSAGTTPDLTLTWNRPDSTGVGLPLTIVGLLVGAIGAVLVAMGRKDPDGLPALLAKLRNGRGGDAEAVPAKKATKAVKGKDKKKDVKAEDASADAKDAKKEKAKGKEETAKRAGGDASRQPRNAADPTPDTDKTKQANQNTPARTQRISLFAKDTEASGAETTETEGTK